VIDYFSKRVQLKDGTSGVVKRISDDGMLHIAAEPVGWAHAMPNEVEHVVIRASEYECHAKRAEDWARGQTHMRSVGGFSPGTSTNEWRQAVGASHRRLQSRAHSWAEEGIIRWDTSR